MSKWINKDLFSNFQKQKKEEKDSSSSKKNPLFRGEIVWKTPQKGTVENPKVYEGRFITDKKGKFYEKYSYHMFQCGEKWFFSLCPKTYGFDNYCPLCSITSKLYQGTPADKKIAYKYKRKEKFVSNFYILSDPRDVDAEVKVNKTVKLYEFPGKVEMKLKEEITDTKNGYGLCIFDPGTDGHNFILKVLSTKKDQNGKIWPDYSSSTFSRESIELGTDKEIDVIMESTVDIGDYIEGLKVDDEKVVKAIKDEMLWDLVKTEWKTSAVDEEEVKEEVLVGSAIEDGDEDKEEKEEDIDDSKWDDSKDFDDEQLLAELKDM